MASRIGDTLEHTHAYLFVTELEFIAFAFYTGAAAGALAIRQPELGELIDTVQSVRRFIVTGPTLSNG